MNYLIYCVKDVVSGQFSDLKLFVNEDCAKRWFNSLLNESKIAQDLQLFYLGDFNVQTGAILPCVDFVQGGADNV